MSPEESIGQEIAEIRTRMNVELRVAANENPELTITLQEVADLVDAALQEISQALSENLDVKDQDQLPGQTDWWMGYPREHPHSWWQGTTEEHALPHVSSASSWWDSVPSELR